MRTRSPSKYIVETLKEQGAERIVPSGALRFISEHLDRLPERWSGLSRDGLLKELREACERGVATGLLTRKREKDITGYVYYIK